jgi:O-methyltransferase
VSNPAEDYLELLKRALTNELYKEHEVFPLKTNNALRRMVLRLGERFGLRITRAKIVSDEQRHVGGTIMPIAHTSIGRLRLDNLHECIRQVLADGVPGDLIETGVWRGGAAIFMRGVLKAYGEETRVVWAADSFEGLPPPDGRYTADIGARWHTRRELAISLEQVQDHFRRYGLLDEQVRFLKGWFKDTLPAAPIEKLAIMRLDGDMYGSTMDALVLYDKLSPGGYVIVDDYGGVDACRKAVDDFRAERGITDPIEKADWTGAFWRKG